ncbi:hypothetical protein Ssi03_50590 [Sphaerisporangium siamense]|uniref:Putative RecA/RadA family phage recombinase n=1 Tax=Sphaerisporangium siamense TaxID=795645 RepID=A0A7W7D8L2_9ACTN|nr:DUF2190 family protein [Sphaerisporangium siamense]MBB4702237.1 putative RecA/RadA family phage recombinase [Sphaerisporangium siamense]GII87069.1 hypothetical protein Ssi03_50590 [Sphaerisporangium siamense]
MATNTEHMWTKSLSVPCTAPTTPNSGDPVLYGQLPGVALIDEQADGLTTIALDGVFRLPVKGETTTNAAVNAGDILYYDSGVINKDSSNGVRFGYALDAVASGATTTIGVLVGY